MLHPREGLSFLAKEPSKNQKSQLYNPTALPWRGALSAAAPSFWLRFLVPLLYQPLHRSFALFATCTLFGKGAAKKFFLALALSISCKASLLPSLLVHNAPFSEPKFSLGFSTASEHFSGFCGL
jgi:hypothetical protein